jgi:hypothetical protein
VAVVDQALLVKDLMVVQTYQVLAVAVAVEPLTALMLLVLLAVALEHLMVVQVVLGYLLLLPEVQSITLVAVAVVRMCLQDPEALVLMD